jgi:hypothetical protein
MIAFMKEEPRVVCSLPEPREAKIGEKVTLMRFPGVAVILSAKNIAKVL